MTEPALAPRPEDAVSSQPNPFSSSDLNYTPAGPMFTPSGGASSSSSHPSTSSTGGFSGQTPAFLNYTPAYGDDPVAGLCRAPDPVSSPGAPSTPARPPPSSAHPADAAHPTAHPAAPGGTAAGGTHAGAPGSPRAAASGGAGRRSEPAGGQERQSRREREGADRDRERQREGTLRKLALPARQAASGVARIGREPLFLSVPSRTWSAPRTLDLPMRANQPPKGAPAAAAAKAETDPAVARQAYATAAHQAEALFERILAASAQLAREADGQLQRLTDRNETQLGLALAQLDEGLAQQRLEAARSRDAVLERIASRADLLRFYIAEQANGALGRMSAMRQELLTLAGSLRKPVVEAAGGLRKAIGAADTAGSDARGALLALNASPSEDFRNSGKFVQTRDRGPAMIEAMIEAAVHYGGPRIQADIKQLTDRWTTVLNFADPIAACGPCEADGKLAGLNAHADNLGVAGPRAIRSTRDGALKSIDRTEQQLSFTVAETHRQAEDGLAERHDQTRLALIGQAAQATLAVRRDIERTGGQQIDALGGVAATQPAAVTMVAREVGKAAAATPTRAAALAIQSAERLQRNVANVAERHPSGVLAMAAHNDAGRLDRMVASGREELAMVGSFGQQQRSVIDQTFGQLERTIDETLFEIAGLPGQVGSSCDKMLAAARKAVTEAKDKLPPQMTFLKQKMEDARDGLIPIAPPMPGDNAGGSETNASSGGTPQAPVSTPQDAPNVSLLDPGGISSPQSSMMSPAGSGGGASGGGPNASNQTDGGGTPAPAPASCAPCETARTAAHDRAAAATPPAPDPGESADAAAGLPPPTQAPPSDDVGVSSDRTDQRSPNSYREHAEPIHGRPVAAPVTDAFLTQVVGAVEGKIGTQVATAYTALKAFNEATDYPNLMNALRGMNATQGAALSEAYQLQKHKDLAQEIRDHTYFGWGTDYTKEHNRDAALDALAGNTSSSAMNELEAAFNWSNETDRIFRTMQSMSQTQMHDFVEAHRDRLNELLTQLSDEDQVRFRLLMEGNTTRVRSMALKASIDQVNQSHASGQASEERGFALNDALAAAENPGERWALEGERGAVDIYGLEDSTVRETREREHWADIQRDFGTLDGVADAIVRANPAAAVSHPNDPPGAMLLAYAARPLELYSVYAPPVREGESQQEALDRQRREYQEHWNVTLGDERTGEYGSYRVATTSMNEYQLHALDQTIRYGARSRAARAARALAQFRRSDGRPPDYRDVEAQTHSGLGDAREGGNFEHGSAEAVEHDRLETFRMMEAQRRQIEGGGTGPISGEAARDMFRDEMARAYRDRPDDLNVALGVIDRDAGDMQAIVDQAIAREDPALLNRYLGRMDSRQIEDMVATWNARHPHGPGLRETLGVGKGNRWSWHNWNGAVFSGDEANTLEIAMLGVPQTPQQKGEVALRIVDQQIDESGWMGRLLANDEYSKLVEQATHLRETMGVTEGDVDGNGRIRMRSRDGEVFYGNFGRDGQFRPEAAANSTALNMLSAGARIVADNYTNAVDRIAAIMTTIVAVIGAIVLTVVTFGAGASVLVAMAVAAGFGALTIGINASMRGGRYSRDDLTRDVVSAAIQIATAGLNVGLAKGLAAGGKLIQAGVAVERALTMSERLLVAAARNPLITQMLTQGALGGLSNLTSTALDPAMRRRGDYGDEVMHSFFRGFAGGAVTAGVAHGLNTGAAALARKLAVNRAIAAAMAQGVSRTEAIEQAAAAAVRTSSGRFMEIGMRGLVGATSATAGRATEMGFDNVTGMHAHGSDEFYLELRNAFIQNAIQGMGEGTALRGSRTVFASHAEEHAATVESERNTAAEEAGTAFDKEMARYGMGPEAPGRAAQARPPAPTAGDEHLAVRTADEEGGGRRPPAAANDNPGAPHRARAALADGEILRMGQVPEGSIFIHPDSTNLHAANDNFGRLLNADPSREVAIYYNPGTGEYLVIQGGPRSVAMIRHDGEIMGPGVTGLPASILAQHGGHWELRTHFHPNRPGQAQTNMARRLPSGRNGDFGVIEAEARFLAMHAEGGVAERTSRVYFVDEGKLSYTDFSVRIEGGQATYRVSFPDPVTGARMEPPPFRNIGEYHAFFRERTGVDPVTGRSVRARTADSETGGLDPARRAGGETARLGDAVTAGNRTDAEFVAGRMALAEGFEQARASGQAHESGIDPLLGRIATTNDAHDMVTRMGLVDRPDSMRRLAALLNDPALRLTENQHVLAAVLGAVRDATRASLIRRGALAPDEPLLLTLHGTNLEGAAQIAQQGFRVPAGGGSDDDFGRAVYFSTGLHNALEYIAQRGAGAGEILPGMLRGRDMGMEVGPRGTQLGALVDVTPQGAHRVQWEAFVRANMNLLGQAEAMMNPQQIMHMLDLTVEIGHAVFAEDPANAGKTASRAEAYRLGSEHFYERAPFAELDRYGTRGTLFDAFLRHLGEGGDARLAQPRTVLGELGGVLTSGIGHGDQQAVRDQRVLDIVNAQLGIGRFASGADDESASPLRVRTADEPEEVADARPRVDGDVERRVERSFARMQSDAETRGVSAERPGQPRQIQPEGWELIDNTIEGFARRRPPDGPQFRELLDAAPNESRRILREIATEAFAGRERNLSDGDFFAVQEEIKAGGRSAADAQRIAEALIHAAGGTRLHNALVQAAFTHELAPSLREPFAQGVAERVGVGAARQFADRRSPTRERNEMRRLLDIDTEGIVRMIVGEGSWRSRAMRFAMRRVREGVPFREAVADGFLAARILQSESFEKTAESWRKRARAISPELLAGMIRERPDALLGLARTSPQQLAEWFADFVLRQPRRTAPNINSDDFARYVENRMISNVLPVGSEASSVWGNLARMGLRLLKGDAVTRGNANRPGLDIVGFSVPPGSDVHAGGQVRVVIMDDKAKMETLLDSVSAMTGLRLPRNLRSAADEIEDHVRGLERLGAHVDNPEIAEFVAGARSAMRQMRQAARELDAIRPPSRSQLRDPAYLAQVEDILRRNNIVPVISSEYGNVRMLAQWLRAQGFLLDQEYAERLARELDRSRRRASGG